ncbi:MAG: hypothetical protein KC478_15415 [Bacteriovoracaceae bacterium]|nr:hypothetical protein [Bacteriovoracaceae bacterium]
MGQNTKIVTRIAPTPSGYLHLGNALNFILSWWVARHSGGKLWLRIDDADFTRCRDEYLSDIFDSLEWLGLDYDYGPGDIEDFKKNYSQTHKFNNYFEAIDKCEDVFACECSRKQVLDSSTGTYPGTCRDKAILYKKNQCSLRLKVAPDQFIDVDNKRINLDQEMGDFIVWRKDGVPSYQLTSVIDDLQMGVNTIIRGIDLLESTAAQIYLAQRLKLSHLNTAQFYHHPLILDKNGEKYSKSQLGKLNKNHLKHMRESGLSSKELLRELAPYLGLESSFSGNIRDLAKIRPSILK